MPRFAAGVVRFQKDIFPDKKQMFERLSLGQSPEALFFACADSRIETAMITQTEPGELFVCRNAGNIVPPHSTQTGAMTASLEYAVAVLKVPHIVVCGHTECGAMKGAMNPAGLEQLPHVKAWLAYAQGAVAVANGIGQALSDDERMLLVTEQNVLLQLQHLRTHPSVMALLAQNAITLHGWVYDIKTGQVSAYDEAVGHFVPVTERYADELAALAAEDECAA